MKEGDLGNLDRLAGTHDKKTTTGKKAAIGNGADTLGVTLADFRAYMPQHNYIYIPSRQMWPGASVNARIPPVPLLDAKGDPILDDEGEQKTMAAALWLDKKQPGRNDDLGSG
jgi:hypothetical protein